MEIKEISPAEYTAFLEGHPQASLWQTPMMAKMQENNGKEVLYLGLEDEGQLSGVSLVCLEPAHFGRLHARSMRGPVMDYADPAAVAQALEAFKNELKARGVLYWSLNPYCVYARHTLDGQVIEGSQQTNLLKGFEQAGAIHHGLVTGIDNRYEPRWMYVIPTDYPSPLALLKTFERKCQRSIQRTEDCGVVVRELGRDELDVLNGLFEKAEQRHGFSWRKDDYNQRLWDAFHEAGAVRFLVAEVSVKAYVDKLQAELSRKQQEKSETEQKLAAAPSKKMQNRLRTLEEKLTSLEKHLKEAQEYLKDGDVLQLAGGIFFVSGPEVLCLMSSYDDKYAYFCGPYALHWNQLKFCIANHIPRYNLYGVSGEFGDDAEDGGVFAFKRGFGGEVWELPGDFQLPVDKTRYKLFQLAKKLKGGSF